MKAPEIGSKIWVRRTLPGDKRTVIEQVSVESNNGSLVVRMDGVLVVRFLSKEGVDWWREDPCEAANKRLHPSVTTDTFGALCRYLNDHRKELPECYPGQDIAAVALKLIQWQATEIQNWKAAYHKGDHERNTLRGKVTTLRQELEVARRTWVARDFRIATPYVQRDTVPAEFPRVGDPVEIWIQQGWLKTEIASVNHRLAECVTETGIVIRLASEGEYWRRVTV
jgi:hypothetical protein